MTTHHDRFRSGPARVQDKEEKKGPAKKKKQKKLGDGSGVSNKIEVGGAWCGVALSCKVLWGGEQGDVL